MKNIWIFAPKNQQVHLMPFFDVKIQMRHFGRIFKHCELASIDIRYLSAEKSAEAKNYSKNNWKRRQRKNYNTNIIVEKEGNGKVWFKLLPSLKMSEVRGRAVSSYLRAIKAVSSSEKDLSKLSVKMPASSSSATSKRKSHQQQQQQQTTSSSSNTSRRRLLVSNNIRDIQGMFQAFNRHKHKSSNGNIHDSR